MGPEFEDKETKVVSSTTLLENFDLTRNRTESICTPLKTEDYVVQPIVDVSPPKWHLGHTTWFFEEFFLSEFSDYRVFDDRFAYLFNSYYENIGKRVLRTNRGNLSRPTVKKIYDYRKYVNEAMQYYLNTITLSEKQIYVINVGINHEQQHQELLLTDIKYILGHNPLFPVYDDFKEAKIESHRRQFIEVKEGIYEVGFKGEEFCYDNELNRHKVYLEKFEIADKLVTNGEYLAFMGDGGYRNSNFWHAEAWDWLNNNNVQAPEYWFLEKNMWKRYALHGYGDLNPDDPLTHISYYEASAYAAWKGMRLPTEFEWEASQEKFKWGQLWEWTESAYLPYPGYTRDDGALGEYNGKFMVNQKVLRGGSVVTAREHSRPSYRNFFHPHLRWQFTGIRLVKK